MGNAHQDAQNRNEKPVTLITVRVVPTTGASLVIPDGVDHYLVDPAGTLATLNVKMPRAPYAYQEVSIAFSQIITSLTLQLNTNQNSFIGTPSTAATAGQAIKYVWSPADAKWWPN